MELRHFEGNTSRSRRTHASRKRHYRIQDDYINTHAPRVDPVTDTQHAPRVVQTITSSSRWTCEEMKEAQRNDPDLSIILKGNENGQKPVPTEISPLSKTAKVYYMEWDRIELREGMLHRR